MFFSIGHTADSRFPNNHKVHNLWFNCDSGWNQISAGVWYKGYSDNHCQVQLDDSGARLEHDTFRSFPLWHNKNTITNLVHADITCQAWADDQVSMDQHGKIDVKKVNLPLHVPNQTISVVEAQQQIKFILDNTVTNFFDHRHIVPKVYLSGGVDTMLIYALLKSHQKNLDLIKDFVYESDDFVRNNQSALNSYWGYSQLHHWLVPTWLASGSHGDEYLLRGPEVIALLTAWHDIDFESILSQHTQCYHYRYFFKEKNLQIFQRYWQQRKQLQTIYPTKEKLIYQILNILVNDHQHWHLGNTLTWTPFKNIEITKILLQCHVEDLLPQFLDATITKNLIDTCRPGLNKYLSTYKNFDHHQNLDEFFCKQIQ